MFRDFSLVDIWSIAESALVTIQICLLAGGVGSIIGALLGIATQAKSLVLQWAAGIYINVIRGVPLLVIIFLVYFGIPLFFDVRGPAAFMSAVVALTVYTAAYMGEVVRGGLRAVPKGQTEASASLGMSFLSRMRFIVLPQAVPVMVPPGIGFLIALVKDSSLVSVVGLLELTGAARSIGSATNEPLLAFLVVAVFYFVISYTLSMVGLWYERRSHRSATPKTKKVSGRLMSDD